MRLNKIFNSSSSIPVLRKHEEETNSFVVKDNLSKKRKHDEETNSFVVKDNLSKKKRRLNYLIAKRKRSNDTPGDSKRRRLNYLIAKRKRSNDTPGDLKRRRRRLNYLIAKLVPNHNSSKRILPNNNKRILPNNNKEFLVVKKYQPTTTPCFGVQIGDTLLNFSSVLFTESRNYLINYNQNKKVRAKDLAGKVIVLHFMQLYYAEPASRVITHLLDVYNKLQPAGGFEIVFVAITRDTDDIYSDYTKQQFSQMPWPAIPLSGFKSREHLQTIFGISSRQNPSSPPSFIIDPRGVVLQSRSSPLFARYGAAGFPFTKERIQFLDSQDNVARMQPVSIQKLLASPQRDYLIDNDGDEVPLHHLNDKVVGLYFCPYLHQSYPTEELVEVYEELLKTREDFEIVLVYTHGWYQRYHGRTDEAMFMEEFQSMPWLALPFDDTDCNKKLQRIFKYPQEPVGQEPNPRLVIIGPHGKFIEPLGGQIMLKYGVPAFPFTAFSTLNLEHERLKKLKPEMLWDTDSIFTHYDGSQVLFSQFVGKRLIVICKTNIPHEFRVKLTERYLKMKGTDDEFEVIHIRGHSERRSLKNFAEPWLMHPHFPHDSYAGDYINSIFSRDYGLLAFDRDGSVVRKTRVIELGDSMIFPFYHNVDMDKEVLIELEKRITFRIRGDDDGIDTVYV